MIAKCRVDSITESILGKRLSNKYVVADMHERVYRRLNAHEFTHSLVLIPRALPG